MKTMTATRTLLVLAGLGASVAGCATQTMDTAALVQARQDYNVAAANPDVGANAPLELRRAEEALRRAEAVRNEGGSVAEIDNQSYVASRRAQIAQETAGVKGAQTVVANADSYRLQARNSELEQQLRDLQAERTERGLVMTLGDILFTTGRADLTTGAFDRVERLAQFMQRYPARTLRIEGHTDSTGNADSNLRLSEARAQAVRDALTARGVNPSRIVTQGFGETQPVASNTNDSGRQQNRRVDVVISDDGTVAETRY
ncbi:OmpA family protein [Azospirillum doebereinerae]|uniref:OmpA family protein n=1 Tax=Azospirillum doebereinerae TaxID=92933 RepID=UPI001EE54AE1|nr:OmpA family protein [Azospirillum doebereinerae]MCG5242063.1 OmpA family protein [Azospirillum doebereinerae]